MTGYDLADFLRGWLTREDHQDLSACEVILLDKRFDDLRQYVGVANVFWSHVQMEGFIGCKSRQHGRATQKELWTTLRNICSVDQMLSPSVLAQLPEAST